MTELTPDMKPDDVIATDFQGVGSLYGQKLDKLVETVMSSMTQVDQGHIWLSKYLIN